MRIPRSMPERADEVLADRRWRRRLARVWPRHARALRARSGTRHRAGETEAAACASRGHQAERPPPTASARSGSSDEPNSSAACCSRFHQRSTTRRGRALPRAPSAPPPIAWRAAACGGASDHAPDPVCAARTSATLRSRVLLLALVAIRESQDCEEPSERDPLLSRLHQCGIRSIPLGAADDWTLLTNALVERLENIDRSSGLHQDRQLVLIQLELVDDRGPEPLARCAAPSGRSGLPGAHRGPEGRNVSGRRTCETPPRRYLEQEARPHPVALTGHRRGRSRVRWSSARSCCA